MNFKELEKMYGDIYLAIQKNANDLRNLAKEMEEDNAELRQVHRMVSDINSEMNVLENQVKGGDYRG